MQFKPEQKIKRGASQPCKECQVDINKGESYISVIYSDGFRKRLHGAYHENCWKICSDNPRAKKDCQ